MSSRSAVKATSTAKVRPALAAINRLGSDYFLTSHWQVPSAGGQGWPGTQLPAGPLVAYSCPHGAEETLACREVPGGDVRPYPAAAGREGRPHGHCPEGSRAGDRATGEGGAEVISATFFGAFVPHNLIMPRRSYTFVGKTQRS